MNRKLRFIVIAGALLGVGAAAFAATDASLVMLLSFESISGGKVMDSSGKGNDATIKGAVTSGEGKIGKGGAFDKNGHMEVAHNDSLNLQSMTLMTWCKIPADTGDHQSAMEKGPAWATGEYNMLPDYGNKVQLQIFDLPASCADTNEAGEVLDGKWHHIATTFDGSAIKIYVDGVMVGSRDCAGKLNTNTGPLYIGARGGTVRWTVGNYDEMAIFNRALTAAEIQAAMNGITTPVEPRDRATVMWANLKTEATR
jgi:hypothetical protein